MRVGFDSHKAFLNLYLQKQRADGEDVGKEVQRAEQTTAAGGGNRENAKGRNKENFDRLSRRKATIFLTGSKWKTKARGKSLLL